MFQIYQRRVSLVAAVLCALAAGAASAAQWQSVYSGGGQVVELDRASISHGSDGVTVRSRVRLPREVRDPAGGYDGIQALTLFDCDGRRFTTLKRSYVRGDEAVREEPAARRRANPVLAGSLDERMLTLACQGMPAGGQASAESKERAVAMHADMRALDEGTVARAFPVADSTSAEKPRLIQLPAIDKTALTREAEAQAAAVQALKDARQLAPSAKEAPAAKPLPLSRDSWRSSAPASLPPRPAATAKAEPKGDESLGEKRLRELQYANSGPPRASRGKARATPASEVKPAEQHAHPQHWSYEGGGGPEHWGRLRPDYATCASGTRQSPIDIRDGIKVNLENIRFDYQLMRFRIIDNGHTVQVNVGDGSSLYVMGRRYMLRQFHFHRPAEERVDGRSYDMSVHLVHRDDEGQLAVLAVLLEKGADHPLIQTVLNNLPLERDVEMTPDEAIDPNKLLPENRAYWTYMGSLTTPPCTEGVLWMVLKQPLQVGADQAAIFSRLFGRNARPVQAMNGRLIKESR